MPKPPGYDMGGNYNATGYGEDGGGMQNFDFSDKSIRRGFIRYEDQVSWVYDYQ